MPKAAFDVVIVGAGAAGLAAASEIARAGYTALVVEARDRIGGRCWSLHVSGFPVAIELGAEFIHGTPAATLGLLREAGTAALDTLRNPWILRNGSLEPREDLLAEIQQAMRASRMLEKRDVSFEVFLERALRPHVSQNALTFARMLVQGYDAADPRRASARAIVREWTHDNNGASLSRPMGGYSALLAELAGRLAGSGVQIRLQSVAREVRWKRGAVEIAGSRFGTPFRIAARSAVITLPVGVLQAAAHLPGALRFAPALAEKKTALRRLAAGPVTKVALRFRSAFWETLDGGRYRDATFFHSPGSVFPTYWTALPLRVPLLTAWAGGPNAMRLSRLATTDIVREALAGLRMLFGRQSRLDEELTAVHLHDWQRDPFARGAYGYVTVGGEKAREVLAASVKETLYFAGEAADLEGEAGTVAGALQSGRRAARELIAAL